MPRNDAERLGQIQVNEARQRAEMTCDHFDLIDATGWTGVTPWGKSHTQWEHSDAQYDEIRLNVCARFGHHMVRVFDDDDRFQECSQCGRCNEPMCCDLSQP